MSSDADYPLTPVERVMRRRKLLRWAILIAILALAIYAFVFANEYVIAHNDELEHFKYGSIGSETASGLPRLIFQALPVIYRDKLGADDYSAFGFIYEDGRDLPIGVSTRVVDGVERAWLNCAVCHVGTVRGAPDEAAQLIFAGPSNNLRLYDFITFLLDAGRDPGFNAATVIAAINSEAVDGHLYALQRLFYRAIVVPRVKSELLALNDTLDFVSRQHDWGPGRVDTFNPYKAIQFNFPMGEEYISGTALNGASDYPSVWQQRPREGMNLHWDGNNASVSERNLSAALGAGVTPRTVDVAAIERVADWLWDLPAPAFPWREAIDLDLARQGEALFSAQCASCHGMKPVAAFLEEDPDAYAKALRAPRGRPAYAAAGYGDASQAADRYDRSQVSGYDYYSARYTGLGDVVPLPDIGTDPGRWASYTDNFAAAQNMLYAGTPHRFTHFRKTPGYANHPLDGIWARSPYLHNGSVPTLRDLLEPADQRPKTFWRGRDVFDMENVGYRTDPPANGESGLFFYDTSVSGNTNSGHEGAAYGTDLTAAEKDALVEYMKTL